MAFRGRLFAVHAFPNESGISRLGLSVSGKVGNAVIRNRIRRRLREIFHGRIEDLPENLDLVVSARPESAGASFDDLAAEFSKALKKIERAF